MPDVASTLGKLRAMTLGEIAGRGLQELDVLLERWTVSRTHEPSAFRRTVPGASSGLAASERTPPARAAHPRFLPSLREGAAARALYDREYAVQRQQTVRRAERALRHEYEFFGRGCALGPTIDWHADPLTAEPWPRVYHRDVPFGDPATRRGDVKHVWELNRHQFLLDLGKAWFLTHDTRYLLEIRSIVSGWTHDNPYGIGVNWAGPLEVAYRALSWMWADAFTAEAPRDAAFERVWLAGVRDHGRFLDRHLELYASPYNHLIGEASVLYMLGVMYPDLRSAPRWRRRGREVLVRRLADQFYCDGGSVEQSPVYHHATLGFYLLAALVGRANGEELPRPVWAAIQRAVEFSVALQQPNGEQPAIGDNDDARCIVFEWRPTWDFRHFPAIGAAIFDRPDFRSAAGRFHEEAFWLLGRDGHQRFHAMAAQPTRASVHLAGAGYVVLRTGAEPDADYVCFDCGEQAGGLRHDDVPSAAHGHSDCLSVVASLRGVPALVDSGLYTYNGDEIWERHFRETSAHNTVRVAEADQARHHGKMSWSRVPRACLHAHDSRGRGGWAVASHDGYLRAPVGVVHTRAVWMRASGCILIVDSLQGRPADIELNWHIGPGLHVEADGEQSLRCGPFSLAWIGTRPLPGRVAMGGPGPEDGWVAPHLGQRLPAPSVTVKGRTGEEGLSVVTVLADRERCGSPVTSNAGEQLTVAVASDEGVVTATIHPWSGSRDLFELRVEVRSTHETVCDTIVVPSGVLPKAVR